jgi:hypothetical protein
MSGIVGIGILNADLSAFVAAEQSVSPEDTGCDLYLAATEAKVWLVIRNISPTGLSSCVEVNSVEAFRAVPLAAIA